MSQPPDAPEPTATSRSNFNLPLKTTGGTQVWTDFRFRSGYRVQQNALTKHFRLLDAENVRRAWGNKEQCLAELERRVPKPDAGAAKTHVILVHGLMRTAGSMKTLEQKLIEAGNVSSVRFSYASTRGSVESHAAALREVLEDLPPNDQFQFVGHSMGNIVVRALVADLQQSGDPQGLLPRCERMVMLGPPNQGAAIARRLSKTKVFGWVTGQGAMELGPEWKKLEANLATPPFPFHIIAGDIQSPIPNPLVDGESDFVVSLEEAKLEGSETFETYPVLHSFLMDDSKIIDRVLELLSRS
ncbi:MAG: lipase [Planctomycetota bacterium]